MIPTSVKSDKITFEEVREAVCAYINDEQQLSVINKAYEFARLKHAGQVRKSGEPYIIHPLNVALILAKIYANYETISAGLMHDVLEDCDCSVEEMEDEFGVNITRLVTGVTRLSRINFSTENEYLIDYYKKMGKLISVKAVEGVEETTKLVLEALGK